MALWKVQVFKNLTGADREWTNAYLLSVDLANVEEAAKFIAYREVEMHSAKTYISRVRASTVAEGDNSFFIYPIGLVGTFSPLNADSLPLYNTVRVDINVGGGGRPSRKFYRLPLSENDQSNGQLVAGVITFFNTKVQEIIDGGEEYSFALVDPDLQPWVTPVTQQAVQMRQLHRKRKKKVTP